MMRHRIFMLSLASALLGYVQSRAAIMEDSAPALFGKGEKPAANLILDELSETNETASETWKIDPELAKKIEAARSAADQNPASAMNHLALGELLMQADLLDEAAESFWRSARLNPLNAAPLHLLGYSLLALGDHENGLKIYRQLEARYADARNVVFNLGAAHYGIKEYEAASIYFYRYITSARQDNPRAFYNYGVSLLAQGKAAEALGWLEKSYASLSANPFVLAALIRTHKELGNEEARARLAGVAEETFGQLNIKPILDAAIFPVYVER